MLAASGDGRRIRSADELFDVAREIADGSADPEATYEGFLRGLEMGLSYAALSPVMTKAIGNKLADLRPDETERPIPTPSSGRTITDPRRPMIRRAPERLIISDTDFPTEWTLEL